jgi:hypothetical protein
MNLPHGSTNRVPGPDLLEEAGATIQHPGWGGNDVGFLPFPAS